MMCYEVVINKLGFPHILALKSLQFIITSTTNIVCRVHQYSDLFMTRNIFAKLVKTSRKCYRIFHNQVDLCSTVGRRQAILTDIS
jgi:hypothetical protein